MVRRFCLLAIILFLMIYNAALAALPTKTDVLIVGAGLSGLATAYHLKKAGIAYHIVEIAPRVGGRVRTVTYERDGKPSLHADSGMEEYWESNPAVPILKELKLPLLQESPASSMILNHKLEMLKDKENLTDFLRRIFSTQEMNAFEKFRSLAGPLITQIKTLRPIPASLIKLKNQPFSAWVAHQKLPLRVSEWIRISIECEIGTQWDQISALDGLAEFHIFLGTGELGYRVIGGNEVFTRALADSVDPDRISLNERVTRVETRNDSVLVSLLNQATHHNQQVLAKTVVSTIPLYRLSELQFTPPLSEIKRRAIASQTWGSYFKAHVFLPRSAERFYLKPTGNILPIISDSDLGVIYEGNPDQSADVKLISHLITGSHAEKFTMMSMDEVRKQILAEFDHLWPGFSKEVLGMEFYRYHPRAIAGWPVGRSRFDELSEAIRTPENRVYFAGDFTESTHSSGAFESAARVSKQLINLLKGADK